MLYYLQIYSLVIIQNAWLFLTVVGHPVPSKNNLDFEAWKSSEGKMIIDEKNFNNECARDHTMI